jgi:DNA-binding HxlR family transcriptional regulator
MESKAYTRCILPPLKDEIIRLIGSRGTIEILFIFCCTEQSVRFSEINKFMSHISTKTLSTRLKQLVDKGILLRTVYNEIPPRVEYSITDAGQHLVDSLIPLINWVNENQS